ncbi:MAG: glucose-6-phosphate isomerase [Thermotogota bacterium]|nr:glucose-6-phosphate isomerase [Thermotogota bacterium]
MLKFDFSNCFKENLGTGFTVSELLTDASTVTHSLNYIEESVPGFLRILKTDESLNEVKSLEKWVQKFDSIVVIGIGGSALGNRALHSALKGFSWNDLSNNQREGKARVLVLDNVDPESFKVIIDKINFKNTLFNVISKSGTTVETMANYLVIRQLLENQGIPPKEHFLFTTDSKKGVLREIADKEGIRTLNIPHDVGGRFSVLTQVGLLSAMAEGINIEDLYEGAKKAVRKYINCEKPEENPLVVAALIFHKSIKQNKNISVMMPYSKRLYDFADWYRQLWAESLGKRYDLDGREVNIGQTPVKALGAIDQHSQIQLYNEGPNDKIITFIKVNEFSNEIKLPVYENIPDELQYLSGNDFSNLIIRELEGTAAALTNNGVQNMTVIFDKINESSIGDLIVFYELLTAVMGKLLNIDPYNQPGVELGKKITRLLMGKEEEDINEKIVKAKRRYLL